MRCRRCHKRLHALTVPNAVIWLDNKGLDRCPGDRVPHEPDKKVRRK